MAAWAVDLTIPPLAAEHNERHAQIYNKRSWSLEQNRGGSITAASSRFSYICRQVSGCPGCQMNAGMGACVTRPCTVHPEARSIHRGDRDALQFRSRQVPGVPTRFGFSTPAERTFNRLICIYFEHILPSLHARPSPCPTLLPSPSPTPCNPHHPSLQRHPPLPRT